MDAITQIGCICCLLFYRAPGTPGAVHHLLNEGGRRIGHLATICLCDPGHHQKGGAGKIPRHPSKALFEQAYGTEAQLLARTRAIVEARFGFRIVEGQVERVPPGVDIDRIHHLRGAVRRG